MRSRHQSGYLYRKGQAWFVRYYDNVFSDGNCKRVQIARKVASVKEYPRKADVWPLVQDLLAPLNSEVAASGGAMTLGQFVETVYLPFAKEQHRPSTSTGYEDIWRYHLKARCQNFRVRDFKTFHGEQILKGIARTTSLSRTTLKHIKSLLSGVFKHAKRQGFLNGVNPMQDVSIPAGKEPLETYAYTLDEITKMLAVLPSKAAAVVATAAFTGARRGELRGMLWENYDGKSIRITQSVWRGHVTAPKTRKSKAPVPVIAQLARVLEQHRLAAGSPSSGLIFPSQTGAPLDIADLARRVIRPALESAGLQWRGWHACRRGLATNLYRLNVPDKTIQAILRHSNLSTTMNCYVKSIPADAVAAMEALEAVCTNGAPAEDSDESTSETLVM